MRTCELRNLGRIGYAAALDMQEKLTAQRKRGEIPDQLLIVEHPHVLTLGRNSHTENLLASEETLAREGIELHSTNRGGDITYHGPGQIVCYPILDLREWKRDVVAYVRTLEQVIIVALAQFEIAADRVTGCTGVWVDSAKIAAIGVHISRWVTSHGFALNVSTDLSFFQYIVPCGLTKPVTSLRKLGCDASREAVIAALAEQFSNRFECQVLELEKARLS
jgi:lipoyl(octanoyl) transferase